jgi:hypothetical protein
MWCGANRLFKAQSRHQLDPNIWWQSSMFIGIKLQFGL